MEQICQLDPPIYHLKVPKKTPKKQLQDHFRLPSLKLAAPPLKQGGVGTWVPFFKVKTSLLFLSCELEFQGRQTKTLPKTFPKTIEASNFLQRFWRLNLGELKRLEVFFSVSLLPRGMDKEAGDSSRFKSWQLLKHSEPPTKIGGGGICPKWNLMNKKSKL